MVKNWMNLKRIGKWLEDSFWITITTICSCLLKGFSLIKQIELVYIVVWSRAFDKNFDRHTYLFKIS